MTQELFKNLFDKWYIRLSLFAGRIVEDEELGKDIASELFVRLWLKLNDQDIVKDSESSFMYRITKNICIDYIRRRKSNRNLKKDLKFLSPEGEDILDLFAIETEALTIIYEQVENLPRQAKVVFKMYLKGCSTPEISKELKIARQTVLNQKTIAITKLKKVANPKLYVRARVQAERNITT